MDKLQIKLLSDNATLPTRNHSTDAGFDIYAAETVVLEPQEKALIATDIAVNIPKGYVGLLTSRSGVSSKTHLVIETGKIDAGFQGHMQINIKNDNEELASYDAYSFIPLALDIAGKTIQVDSDYKEEVMIGTYQINKGDKLAQLVIVPIITPELEKVEEFDSETARGEKGFGSSGI
ncbi:TPA: dUTP pyrophosphatase [Staphylococcus pseudintermedius]|uniref:dUTP diphosphatase n=4 Tax=root TaxID=1 RepID=A0A1J0MG68_9CAUD|nr:dUTP pyrophosphatase [Staphylococcus pseudintermedius]YP_010082034.1 dUTP pyrophosphatase [Staphylococcus phage vB_SpsM_WIS42]APD19930.1 deoxyuridine triphosphate nucleotidohydrolase [Staphylococcus phage SpT252]ASU01311.1 deoxyuridine 5'-triphosphate nucleotidohydrolase [Staphylococcus phage SN11]AYG57235.1 dUTP pyrophosphatase [Staphylococcus pseudintermedius]EGQ1682260.1 dUTP pyrophosphatase [Staphylococcus pseudintermedius]EGQ2706241.1 dUTP pyrophosphatase [Staphylococcus pseudintermed